ncbi:MAG: monomeric [FeFe] hydrogenase [Alphaproteobacteria bacterium]|nr:monomeric [FeFe] hydrogenase [Alphaproteobacteria bacterium]
MTDTTESETKRLKREILVRLIRAFLTDDFPESARRIPYDMRPKGCEVEYRCCVYKERAILRARTIAGLGFSIEQDDESTLLSDYARRAAAREAPEENPLTVLESACKGCPPSRYRVTDLCQNCVARPCMRTCRFGAISHSDGRSHIDSEKCRKCGLCMAACPYGAIVKTVVPCENACPVDAIGKDASGFARIDAGKCISCGKCVTACPFGAIHAKSQLIDVLRKIKEGGEVVALMAPAIAGHLPGTPGQLKTALRAAGFSDAYEVARGADIAARTEAEDLRERLAAGAAFMTTSCCAAYNELVKKHLPELAPFVSETRTPLAYTAGRVRTKHPDAVLVFLSPCFAKRREVLDNPDVQHVLNFEEVAAIFIARDIDVAACAPATFDDASSQEARAFPLSGGVARAVQAAWTGAPDAVRPAVVNGLDKASIRDLKAYARAGQCPAGNLVEVMSCDGGCIGGNACANPLKAALKRVADYSRQAHPLVKKQD